MKQITSILLVLIAITQCAMAQKSSKNYYTSKDKEYAKQNKDGSYGASFTIPASFENKQQIEDGLSKNEYYSVMIKGTCQSVCQTKGCWLNVQTEDGLDLFVKFKGYAFFLPRDIAGKTVILSGSAYYEIISVEELKHYAEDAKKSKEEIDAIKEPRKRLRYEATGGFVLK
ncbi:MAG: DUF4920 domain-containing protein [Bacteroidota bacterium]|jgi:hypothetical protein